MNAADFERFVELVPDPDPKRKPMESMPVRVVSIRAETARIDVAGRSPSLLAGETRAFREDGAVANSLQDLNNREGDRPREKNRAEEKKEKLRKKQALHVQGRSLGDG